MYENKLISELTKAPIREVILGLKKEFRKLRNPDIDGRKRKKWSSSVYQKFAYLVIEKMVDHMMQSDRILTNDDKFWAITGEQGTKYSNWHTNGLSYSIRINGLKSKYSISLSIKKREELRKRIMSGQKFYTPNGS